MWIVKNNLETCPVCKAKLFEEAATRQTAQTDSSESVFINSLHGIDERYNEELSELVRDKFSIKPMGEDMRLEQSSRFYQSYEIPNLEQSTDTVEVYKAAKMRATREALSEYGGLKDRGVLGRRRRREEAVGRLFK